MIYLSCIFIYGNTAMYSNRSFLILCDYYKYVHSKSLVCIYEIRQSTGYITGLAHLVYYVAFRGHFELLEWFAI